MIAIAVLTLLLGWGQAAPPQDATVRGIVLNAATLGPVADAQVTLVELGQEARTTSEGRFAFAGVPPGRHTLTVSTIGFTFVKRTITVGAAGALDLTIPLSEGTGAYQESVTVAAAPISEVGSSTTEVSSSLLQDLRGVAADDPVRAMQALPGVATGDDFRAEFSVRGSAFRQVGTVIDGTATPLLFHSLSGMNDSGSIAMINSDVLSGASLSAGAHPQTNGDWLGATLTFDVREGSRDRTTVRGAVSGTNASAVVEGPLGRGRRGSWLFSARKSYIDWLVKKIIPDIDSTLGFADAQGKVVYDLTSRQQIQILFIGGDALFFRAKASGGNQVKQSDPTSDLTSALWRYTQSRLLVQQRVSFVTNGFRNTGSIGQEQAVGHTHSWVYRGDLSLSLGRQWTFDAGLKSERERLTQTLREFMSQSTGLKVRREQQIAEARTTAGGWAELTRRTSTGNVTLGARAANDSAMRETVVSPWILAEHRFAGLTFHGSAGDVSQFPTLEHLGQPVDATHPILTEHAWTADVGAGRQLTPAIQWKATAFYRDESNILRQEGEDRLVNGARVTAAPFPVFGSTLDGTSRGVELVISRHATSGPSGWLGYTWAHTREHDRLTNESFDGDFDQRHTLNIFVEQRVSFRMKATAKFRYGSNFPLVGYFEGTPDNLHLSAIRNGVRLPTYARLDLSGSRTFTYNRRRLTLFVELMNVTDRKNYGQADGSIHTNFVAVDYLERLIPFVPSAGMLLEF